jgi:hypothetical protein
VTSPRPVAVVPLVFNGQGCVGDFAWMIEQPTYGRALDHVRGLLAIGNYDTPYFRRSASGPTLGTGIFEVAPEVRQYVYDELCGVGDADHAQYQQ